MVTAEKRDLYVSVPAYRHEVAVFEKLPPLEGQVLEGVMVKTELVEHKATQIKIQFIGSVAT